MIFWEILLAALSREGIWTGWTMGRHRKITPKMSPLFFKSFRSLWWNCRGGNLMPRKNISAYLPFTYWHKRVTRKCHLYEHVLDILYSPLQVHSPAFSILFGGSGVYCNTDCIAWTLWSFWFGQKHQEEIKGQKEREVFFFSLLDQGLTMAVHCSHREVLSYTYKSHQGLLTTSSPCTYFPWLLAVDASLSLKSSS